MVSLDFTVTHFLPTEPWPWGRLSPPVTMSTRNIPGAKGSRCVRLTTYHHTVPLSRNLGALTSQTSLGLRWPVTGVLYLFILYNKRVFVASEFHFVLFTTLLFDFLLSECNSVLVFLNLSFTSNSTSTSTSLKVFVTPKYSGQVI